jgi:hypothetical protein
LSVSGELGIGLGDTPISLSSTPCALCQAISITRLMQRWGSPPLGAAQLPGSHRR